MTRRGRWAALGGLACALLELVNGEAMERLRDLIGNNDFYLTIME